ncbi:hypothetical protein T265_03592 [Opisthorchis viverrini]|uniref:Uncharacterized protein n=1 Tax=Opisthorchis viverrini TaxID=6198 RepID=A0A074ZRZ6_OPIVI|nr:hypothetical protein T265_03592 [Opisthorchis viverrini]KER29901.1 hypothetical protein T265_03592 [Opisthorchis viverrini]
MSKIWASGNFIGRLPDGVSPASRARYFARIFFVAAQGSSKAHLLQLFRDRLSGDEPNTPGLISITKVLKVGLNCSALESVGNEVTKHEPNKVKRIRKGTSEAITTGTIQTTIDRSAIGIRLWIRNFAPKINLCDL